MAELKDRLDRLARAPGRVRSRCSSHGRRIRTENHCRPRRRQLPRAQRAAYLHRPASQPGHQPACHELSVLPAQVSVPGQANLDQIEIGLSGEGTTALNIFGSLQPAP